MRLCVPGTCFILCCVLALCQPAAAQWRVDTIGLTFNDRDLRQIGPIPFSAVEVLDNRFDTNWLYAWEDGTFPPHTVQLGNTASVEIQQYLQQLADTLGRGATDTLLVRLRQLRVGNRNIQLKTNGKSSRRARYLRWGMLLAADLYRKKQGLYVPLVTIHKLYPMYGSPLQRTITDALNEMLKMSGASATKDTVAFRYSTDSTPRSLQQIDVNVQDTWAGYPVMQEGLPADGLFMQFDDFQNNRLTADNFHLNYNEQDSLFHLSVSRKTKRYPWAVADSGGLYIHVLKDVYVKTWRYHNTRCFYIPRTLPDMYTLLSIENGAGIGDAGLIAGNSGNLLVDLGVLAVGATVEGIMTGAAQRKIKKRGMQSNLRYCYIDMDYGDVLYGQAMPDL